MERKLVLINVSGERSHGALPSSLERGCTFLRLTINTAASHSRLAPTAGDSLSLPNNSELITNRRRRRKRENRKTGFRVFQAREEEKWALAGAPARWAVCTGGGQLCAWVSCGPQGSRVLSLEPPTAQRGAAVPAHSSQPGLMCVRLLPSPEDMLIDLREGGREGDRGVEKKHQWVAPCTHPDRGPNPQPRHVP